MFPRNMLKKKKKQISSKASENSYKPQLHKQEKKKNHQQTVITPPNRLWGFPYPPSNQRQSNDVIMHWQWVGSCV